MPIALTLCDFDVGVSELQPLVAETTPPPIAANRVGLSASQSILPSFFQLILSFIALFLSGFERFEKFERFERFERLRRKGTVLLALAAAVMAWGAVMPPAVPFRVMGDQQSPWWAAKYYWDRRHQEKLHEIMRGREQYDFVFIGDTHIHHWEGWKDPKDVTHHSELFAAGKFSVPNGAGINVWRELRRSYRLLNVGMVGDTTQNILWRLDNGELDDYKTRGFVVCAGANNSEEPAMVADGVRAILDRIFEIYPLAKVVLSPILPCEGAANGPKRLHDEAVNALIRKFADGKKVFWCDFNKQLLGPDGVPDPELLPGGYLSSKGYGLWRDALLPYFRKICKQ